MRRTMLAAGVGLVALAGSAVATGVPVVDALANIKLAAQALHNLKDEVAQNAQLAELVSLYRTTERAYYEANAITNISSLSEAYNYAATRYPLPTEIGDMVSLMQGVGTGGPIGGQVVGFLERNVVYAPRGEDFQAWRMAANAQSTAGQMAIAQQSYDASTRRLQGADDLQTRMGTARTVAEKADLQARGTIELNRTSAQTNHLLSVMLWQGAQRDADNQAQEQSRRQSVDRMIDEADSVIANRGRRGPNTGRGLSLVASR